MKALISGQAGIAVILGKTPQLWTVDDEVHSAGPQAAISRLFDGCADVESVEVGTLDEIKAMTSAAWARDRALKLFLFLIDPAEPEEDLQEYALCIEELAGSHNDVLEYVERRVMADSLPLLIEITRVERASADCPMVLELFSRVMSVQSAAREIRAGFEAVGAHLFGGLREKHECRTKLIEDGEFRRVALASAQGADLSFLKLQILAAHRQYASPIQQWFAILQPGLSKSTRPTAAENYAEFDDDFDEEQDYDERHHGSHAAYTWVKAQKHIIIEKLRGLDIEGARHTTSDLVQAQRLASSDEQTAKTLCSLAQAAKALSISELQIEWAEEATLVNPNDPMTFGHLADALIRVGRYQEAEEALAAAESRGDRCYAEIGRGRILRSTGRLVEARERYLATAHEFDAFPNVQHAWAGAAEVLRDMGDAEGAAAEYKALTDRFPLEAGLWAGLATAYMDLGRLDDAIHFFGVAATRKTDRQIAECGQATAYKLAGNFSKAIEIYSKVIRDYPNDHVAYCGQADVFRAQGDYDAALNAYEQAMQRAPFSPVAYAGKASLLKELGNYSDSIALYDESCKIFPHYHGLASGRASVLKSTGRLEEALQAYDGNIARFPFDMVARVSRADVLRRLGQSDAALTAYDAILTQRPYFHLAENGKAALLIVLGRFREAGELLRPVTPRTQVEWTKYLLRSLLVSTRDGVNPAARMLERGIRDTPFATHRKSMRSALASLEMRRGRQDQALKIVQSSPLEISNVVQFHALAASYRSGQARRAYSRILESEMILSRVDLAKEIARRYKIVDEPPRESKAWIFRAEQREIILDAA